MSRHSKVDLVLLEKMREEDYLTNQEIAARMGVTIETVCRAVKKHGLPNREPGRRRE